jgi:hypothetical protein
MILNVNFGIEGLIKRERERRIRWATKLAHKQAHLTNIERSSFGIKSWNWTALEIHLVENRISIFI